MKRFLVFFFFFIIKISLFAQVSDTALWIPNGPVNSVYLRDSILYVGGNFSQISPVSGHFTANDSVTAATVLPFPMVRGKVNCIAKDSLGRIYVGGNFSEVGIVPWKNLFRLDANGNFDATFRPDPDAEVTSLYVFKDTLYVGGNFTNIEGFPRERGASFHVTDSMQTPGNDSLLAFDPQTDDIIYAFGMDTVTRLMLIGGKFLNVGGQPATYLTKVDPQTGIYILSGPFPWRTTVDGPVKCIEVEGTFGYAYIAGEFSSFATTQRKGMAVVYLSSGNLDLSFNAGLNGIVNDMKFVGSRIYIGGAFTIADGQNRFYLACLTLAMHVLPWAPVVYNEVFCIQPWNDAICIGGKFKRVATDTVFFAAIIDSTGAGNVHAWNPMFDAPVNAMMPGRNGKIFCGGDFTGAGGVLRSNLCSINIYTQTPTLWAPTLDAQVHYITANTNSLFITGDFGLVNSQNRARIASFDLSTGNVNAFNPGANGLIRSIALNDSIAFLGGNFTTIAGQARNNIACVTINNSLATAWNPGCTGTVNKLILDNDHLYVAGFFPQIGGQMRDNFARVSTTTALVDWNWICNTDNGIYDMDLYNGKLFLGGWFSQVAGIPRVYFASVDTASGTVLADNPMFDQYTRSFARYNRDLFISGAFSIVGSSNYYPGVCDYDNFTSSFEAWTPMPDAFPVTMAATQDWLFAGGSFSNIGYRYHPNLSMININNITSVNEIEQSSFMQLFPDPTNGIFTVSTKNISEKISRTGIYDVTGQEISAENYSGIMNGDHFSFDISSLANGIYFLRIETADGRSFSGKIVKD
ncbi:MAG: T9SS type A sorting domain-containing protein [Bacteroidetes bacterium]|nr:T9SS type A sorting domain-containing protein [Bacteroidota bacterium]